MKCPYCKQTIDQVRIITKCWRWATLKDNKIANYQSTIEPFGNILGIWCIKCLNEITSSIQGANQ